MLNRQALFLSYLNPTDVACRGQRFDFFLDVLVLQNLRFESFESGIVFGTVF